METIENATTSLWGHWNSYSTVYLDVPQRQFAEDWFMNFLWLLPRMMFGYFAVCFVIHNTIVWFGLGPKIQPKRKDIISVRINESMWSASCVAIGAIYIGLCMTGHQHGLTKIYFTADEYGWVYLIGSFIGMWIVNDAWQYWTHRFLHIKKLYPYIHGIHHKFIAPSTYATMAFHPIESCVQFHPSLLLFIFPIYFPVMIIVASLFFFISVMEHSGFYVLPYERFGWLFSTPLHHDIHHSRFRCNFAVYFTLWDKFCGTENHKLPEHIVEHIKNKRN